MCAGGRPLKGTGWREREREREKEREREREREREKEREREREREKRGNTRWKYKERKIPYRGCATRTLREGDVSEGVWTYNSVLSRNEIAIGLSQSRPEKIKALALDGMGSETSKRPPPPTTTTHTVQSEGCINRLTVLGD